MYSYSGLRPALLGLVIIWLIIFAIAEPKRIYNNTTVLVGGLILLVVMYVVPYLESKTKDLESKSEFCDIFLTGVGFKQTIKK